MLDIIDDIKDMINADDRAHSLSLVSQNHLGLWASCSDQTLHSSHIIIIMGNSYKALFSNSVCCPNNSAKTAFTCISTNFTIHATFAKKASPELGLSPDRVGTPGRQSFIKGFSQSHVRLYNTETEIMSTSQMRPQNKLVKAVVKRLPPSTSLSHYPNLVYPFPGA